MHEVYLEVGGNQGDRLELIIEVKKQIAKYIGEIVNQSSIYETPPWGFESELNFYNQIILVESNLEVSELLASIHKIELSLGRIRGTEQYISRTMDIDILFYGIEVIDQLNIQVPHPRIQDRKFVLIPLAELNDLFVHPKLNKTINQLLLECTDTSKCLKLNI
ncbi:MAG: 2-amino-4-hydroxy-6-hydroxymethyldihydropteridine diphosphokinase [Salinivirgaceae bacterium]|nr:2-amino-4-hydroxy-6-hydroxymethyldihydropteridine diphosphokinase [Salinivirgaceae bacterium]